MVLASNDISHAQDGERSTSAADTEEVSSSLEITEKPAPIATGKGPSIPLTRSNIIALQHTVGNQAVQRMIARQKESARPARPAPVVQRKAAIPAPVEIGSGEEEAETEAPAELT